MLCDVFLRRLGIRTTANRFLALKHLQSTGQGPPAFGSGFLSWGNRFAVVASRGRISLVGSVTSNKLDPGGGLQPSRRGCFNPSPSIPARPNKINRLAVQNLFRLKFIEDKANVIFLAGVGLGKTHLATALGYQACLKGHSVLFTSAVDAINSLAAAQAANRLKAELKKYLAPSVLLLDELGYLPIDKHGADLLFQIISQRYEKGAIIITSNRAFKNWPEIFNNDSTLTSAILDRLLHHAETVLIEGKSYRMKDQIQT